MKKGLLPLLVVFPLTALASPSQPSSPDGPMTPEQRERMEKHGRIMRVVGLAEELELSTAEALRVDEMMRKFDERRRPLRDQVADAAKVLARAAEGDGSAANQVDQAAQRIFDARAQLAQIDKEMFTALSRDLNPQQRAKMAVFFARIDAANKDQRVLMRKRVMDMMGPGGSHMRMKMMPDDRDIDFND